MYALLFSGFVAFALCSVLTPLFRHLAAQLNLVDRPDHGRKQHAIPVPRIGGVPIALSYVAALLVVLVTPLDLNRSLGAHFTPAIRLLPAVAIVFLTGLADDIFSLSPGQKLIGQIAAAAAAYMSGVRINAPSGAEVWWALPATLLWLVACTNALNFIDGVDGLAVGIGLFATLTTLIAAMLHNNLVLVLLTVPLIGALMAFLRFNFTPASIFLGDSGSLLIGFLLGCYGIIWSHKSATFLGMTAPLLTLCIPLIDAVLAVGRRFIRGESIFGADRSHIHHRLLDLGWTPRGVALLLYGACALGACFSLLQSVSNDRFAGAVITIFCVAAWIGIQHLGYVEFDLIGRAFRRGFRQHVMTELALEQLCGAVSRASDVHSALAAVSESSVGFGLKLVGARLNELVVPEDRSGVKTWVVTILLSEDNFVKLARSSECAMPRSLVAPFLDAIEKELNAKLRHFAGESYTLDRQAASGFRG